MAGFFSKVDDFVNEEIPGGWYTVAALAGGGGYYGMNGGFAGAPTGASSTGFSFLPSGEMTVFSPEVATTASNPSWLSSLFTQPPAPVVDGTRQVSMYPTSSGNIFEPSGMSASEISSIQGIGDSALAQQRLADKMRPRMPNMGGGQQQTQADILNRLDDVQMQMRRGQQVQPSTLASLLDPRVAVKAYTPTLI